MYSPKLFATIVGALAAVLAAAPSSAQDLEKGRQSFHKCEACHSLDVGKGKIGPHLSGVFGRVSGTIVEFSYSTALKNAKIVWDEKTMDEYLTAPAKFVKGGKMAFPGLPNEKERKDLIAFLKEATKPK
ncbi:MAG: cytochrome c family protein [Alphaproteobacteria bacterium]|nr:cytochrome c family protein [Alphaproteobacteria bacterium]